ncbi:MAG TPA: Ig-like domain-containing protein, partial [Candidatus Limnocylindrales bacterium]
GGAFPIPEDWGQFAFLYECSAIANDSDAGGTTVSWQVDTEPAHGTLEWLPGLPGVFGYTPDPDYSTPSGDWTSDSFAYHLIDDADVSSNEATYRFWIAPVNDAPTVTAGPFIVQSPEDAPYSAPWATDISPGPNESSQAVHFELQQTLLMSNPPLTFSADPAIAPDGTLSFTPAPNATGYVRLAFVAKDDGGLVDPTPGRQNPDPADTSDPVVVDITVTAVNDGPVAGDDIDTITEDTPGSIGVLQNDSDPDGDPLTVIGTTDGTHGTAAVGEGGTSVFYTPDPDASGPDAFTYTISDGHGGTDTASVSLTITAVADAPVAVDDVTTLGEDASATPVDVLANDHDADLDPLTITEVTDGASGTVSITGDGTGLSYAPATDANGPDSFTYTIDDGQGGIDSATVDVTILSVNDAPTVVGDDLLVLEDQSTASAVGVLANDSDVENDTLTITAKTNGAKGAVTITGGGTSVSYKPNPNAFGADSFTYTVIDGNGGSATATVDVTITGIDDPVNAVNDGVPTPTKVYLKGLPKAIPVLINDSAPDGSLHITAVTQGSHGLVAITGGGTGLTYTATGTATGIDVFTYTISDGDGDSDTASVQVTVATDTTRPVATITSLAKTTISGSMKLKITLKWTLTDTGTGIKSQLLQRRTDSGSWITVSLPSSATRAAAFTMSRGHTYTFRIRGTDRAGNVGYFAIRSIRI